jgi:CPA2 family monovalent cation:H+ antiporter-2
MAFAALGLIPIGEFSYVIAQVGLQVAAISPQLQTLILTSSVVTILFTPTAFRLAPWLARALESIPLLGQWLGSPTIEPGDETTLAGHVVIVGHGRVGGTVADALRREGVPIAVVECDLGIVRQLRAAGISAVYGDAAYPIILHAAHPERAQLIVVALPDAATTRAVLTEVRRVNSSVAILARATRYDEQERLKQAGADLVVVPEVAGAQMLAAEALARLGVPAAD